MSTAREGSMSPVTRAASSGPNARSPIVAVIFDGTSFVAAATRCSCWRSPSNIVAEACSRTSRMSCQSTSRR